MSTAGVLFRGVASNWAGRLCAIAITFVATPIVIHGLGDEAYGVWSMVVSLGAYYTLSNLGLRAAGVKYISQFEAVDDREAVNKVVMAMLVAYVPIAALVLGVAGCIALGFPNLVETEHISPSTLRWVIVVCGASVSVGVVGEVYASILVALRRFEQTNMVGVVSQLVQAIAIVVAVRAGYGLIAMAWIIFLVTTGRQLWTLWLAFRAAPYIQVDLRQYEWSTLRMLLGFGTLNVVAAAARRVNNFGGSIIIGFVSGPVLVTFYAIASSLATKVEELGQGVNSVLMPIVSQLDAQKRQRDLESVFFLSASTLFSAALGVAVVLVVLGHPLIAFWISPEHAAASYPVLCVLAIGMAIRMPSMSSANVLKGTASMKPLVRVAVFEAVLSLSLGFLFVPFWGILGMGCALFTSQVLVAILLAPITCRIIGVALPLYVRKAYLPGLLVVVPTTLVALLIRHFAPPTQLWQVILEACLILAVAGLAIVLACFDPEQRGALVSGLRRKRRRGPSAQPLKSLAIADTNASCPTSLEHSDASDETSAQLAAEGNSRP